MPESEFLQAVDDTVLGLVVALDEVPDPRGLRGRRHRLVDVLAIAVLGCMCGCDNAEALEDWADKEESWLRLYLDLPWGVPSQDTFLRVLASIDARAFRFAFVSWVRAMFPGATEAGQIAIDGKTARRSGDAKADKEAVHMVSALACSYDLVVGQQPTETKSNEISAIRLLLEMLELRGALVSIDAIGCQTDVAQRVLDGGGDYLLATKQNQPELHRALEDAFEAVADGPHHNVDRAQPPKFEIHEEVDAGHGRIETRTTTVISADDVWIPAHVRERWPGITSCIEVRSKREIGEKQSEERRRYISSRAFSPRQAGDAVRTHWRVENRLHYVLDVSFGEDQCTVRKDNAAANFIVLRHFAVSLIRAYKGDKFSVPRRRRQCDYKTDYREQLLAAVAM